MTAVGLQLSAGSQTAFATNFCTGTPATGSTISGSIEVPNGATCTLNNVNVTGSVKVDSGGRLEVNGGTIGSNVTALPGSTVAPNGPSESCSDDPTTAPCAPLITVRGSVTLNGSRFDSPNCPNISIGGNFTINNTDPPVPYSCLSVSGGTVISNNPQGLGFEHATFRGNVTISGNNFIDFGSASGNTLGAGLKVTKNDTVNVENNSIAGNASCSGNSNLTFTGNTVGGSTSGCT